MVHATHLISLTHTVRAAVAIGAAAFIAQAQAAGYSVVDIGAQQVSNLTYCSPPTCAIAGNYGWTENLSISALSSTGQVVIGAWHSDYSGGVSGGAFLRQRVIDSATLQPVSIAFPSSGHLFAYGINASNQVVGVDGDRYAAYVANPNTYSLLTAPTGYKFGSGALGINATGQVTGAVANSSYVYYGFVTTANAGAFTMLGANVNPSVVNSKGQVAGYVYASTGDTAFRTTVKNAVIKLGKLSGDKSSYAQAINDSGVVAGRSVSSTGVERAFVTNAQSKLVDLSASAPTGYAPKRAVGINVNGVVVGNGVNASSVTEPFLYTGGKMTLLNADATIAASGWTLTSVIAINDKGQIAAYASQAGVSHMVVLNPQ